MRREESSRRVSICVGIDQSSNAIELVRLDENRDHATAWSITLEGKTAFARLQQVRLQMPGASWWDNVYLAAIEIPESRFRASLRAQLPIVGAIVACIPSHVQVWDVAPVDWKRTLGVAHNAKPEPGHFPAFTLDGWTQDALDALGVAAYARDLNARGIEAALKTPVTQERKAA